MSGDNQKGFAIHPKLDCPHLDPAEIASLSDFLLKQNTSHFSEFRCKTCEDKTQNWICLHCHEIACSRYVKGHMADHNSQTKHSIALSFSDSSFWCYDCESYIDHPTLVKARKQFSNSKFTVNLQKSDQKQEQKQKQHEKREQQESLLKVEKQISSLNIGDNKQQEKISKEQYYQEVIRKIKGKEYKKVVFLTGAGLSVAAGIPDFRTPGTGLYSQLQKLNLPRPEAVFELNYFIKNPQPFIRLSKEWLEGDFKPTEGHKFIKKLQDQNMLYYCMTQNIDDLESKAGLSTEKLIQAHGHARSAHCVKCKKEADIKDWIEHIKQDKPLVCNVEDCAAYVKPDIVFFGEQLPEKFEKATEYIKEADLVFVIGTSLVVWPFAFLAHMVPEDVPLVLINNTDSLAGRENKIWLDGDIQDNIKKICKDLEWNL